MAKKEAAPVVAPVTKIKKPQDLKNITGDPDITVVVDTRQLQLALDIIKPALPANPILPILNNIRIQLHQGAMILSASNGQLHLMTNCAFLADELTTDIGTSVVVAINGAMLMDLVGTFNSEKTRLDFYLSQFAAKVSMLSKESKSKNSYLVTGGDPAEYPRAPVAKKVTTVNTTSIQILRALSGVCFAVEKDSEEAFSGLLINVANHELHMVGCIGRLLAMYRDVFPGDDQARVILPYQTANILQKLLPADDTPLSMRIGEGKFFLSCGSLWLISSVQENNFPDYVLAMANLDKGSKLTFNRKKLIQAVKISKLYANHKGNQVRLGPSREAGHMVLKAEDLDWNYEAFTRIPVQFTEERLPVLAFNIRLLTDILEVIDSESVTIEVLEKGKPVYICPVVEPPLAKEGEPALPMLTNRFATMLVQVAS